MGNFLFIVGEVFLILASLGLIGVLVFLAGGFTSGLWRRARASLRPPKASPSRKPCAANGSA